MQADTMGRADSAPRKRRQPPRRSLAAVDAARSHVRSFQIAGTVIWALMLRNFRAEYGHRRLGLLWAFMPTLYVVLFFVLILTFIRHKSGILGHEVGPFIALGLLPLQMFQKISKDVSKATSQGKALLAFPRVKVMDLYLANVFLQFAIISVVFTAIMSIFVLLGHIPPPAEPDQILLPVLIAAVFGLGMGLVDTVFSRLISGWSLAWQALNRLLFLTSGIFFIADGFPQSAKDILYYQPLLHLTEWLRSAYYGDFESNFYDPYYPLGLSLALLAFGLTLERIFRNRVLQTKKKK